MVVALGALASGCWTSAQTGEDLLRRVAALEEGVEESRQELQVEIERAQTSVQELEEVLQQATRVVQRSSADTGAQVETLQRDLQALTGQLAELRNDIRQQQAELREQQGENQRQITKLARRVGVDMDLDDAEIPDDVDDHWQAAERAFRNSEGSRARALYRAFRTRYPEEERVDDAQYRIGASYLREERPATALGALRTVLSEHRDGDVVDDALADMAEAFWQLHSCTDARSTAETLLRTYRRSNRAADARRIVQRVQRAPSGYCSN